MSNTNDLKIISNVKDRRVTWRVIYKPIMTGGGGAMLCNASYSQMSDTQPKQFLCNDVKVAFWLTFIVKRCL